MTILKAITIFVRDVPKFRPKPVLKFPEVLDSVIVNGKWKFWYIQPNILVYSNGNN